jgi:KUP system potassium uptake protein
MFVTFFDTCMISLTALIVWRFNPLFVFFPWLTIACLDGVYLSSALVKVPNGAWFTITLSGILTSLFILWRFGKEQQWQAEAEDRFPTTHLVKIDKNGEARLTEKFGGETLSIIKGFGIFFDKAGETTPAVFTQFLSKLVASPEVMVFFHLRPLETPSVLPENRYTVSRLAIPNCYRLIVRHGYMDEVITPNLAALILEQVRNFIICQTSVRKMPASQIPAKLPLSKEAAFQPLPRDEKEKDKATTISSSSAEKSSQSTDESIAADLAKVQQAFDRQILYIIGKEQMKVKSGTSIWRKVLLYTFLWVRENTRTKIANLRVPTERVIEVGFVKEV